MSTSDRSEPDQLRRSTNGLPVTFSLSTSIKRRGVDPSQAPAAELLEALKACVPQPAVEARCLNPTCDRRSVWHGDKGRPKKFCSDTCRQQHEKARQRLEEEIAIIDQVIDNPATRPGQRRALASHRAHRVFELARYPDVRGPRTTSSRHVRRSR